MRLALPTALVSLLLCPVAHSLAVPKGSSTTSPAPTTAPSSTIHHEILRARVDLANSESDAEFDPPSKYFHESTFHHHYDGRFAKAVVPYQERRGILIALVRAYLATMNEIGAETWIMHGSLLGWWWNKRVMPWDDDLDVMISEPSADHLAKYYNMTIHHYKPEDWNIGRDYMLEMNPHYSNNSTADELNRIDGRWIDMVSGLFIDITVLHNDLEAQAAGNEGAMYCKDTHEYDRDEIWPLQESVFEGVPALIPHAYRNILADEYGAGALSNSRFHMHHFDQEVMDWVPIQLGPLTTEKEDKAETSEAPWIVENAGQAQPASNETANATTPATSR